MSTTKATGREKIEPGITRRRDKRGQLRYEINFRDSDGRQRRQTVEGGLAAARTALHAVKADLGRGVRVAPTVAPKFGAVADAWWLAKRDGIRPATQASYQLGLTHLRRHFDNVRLDAIDTNAVARYLAKQRAAGYAAWTLQGHLVVLGLVYGHAQRRMGYTGPNVVRLLERSERPSTQEAKAKRILNADEQRRLLDALPARHRPLFELITETGLRKSEATGLTWADVDLDAATITVSAQLDTNGQRAEVKTERSRRCLEITPAMTHRLRALKLASVKCGPRDFVFITATGQPYDRRNVLRILERACKHAGLGEVRDESGAVIEPRPTVHGLRHAHGSALIAAGWDVAEVSARLGHAKVGITLNVYVHEYDAARRSDERRDRLAALYSNQRPAQLVS